jgi:hypothetical protein
VESCRKVWELWYDRVVALQLDNGAIKLDKQQLALLNHQIHDEYIALLTAF